MIVLLPNLQLSVILCQISISLLIACFPKRLPNHLIIAWFFLLAFTIDRTMISTPTNGDIFAIGILQTLTPLIYLLAGLHKLNKDYFNQNISCGKCLFLLYILQKGLSPRKLHILFGNYIIYLIVIVELLIPILLFFEESIFIGILLGFILAFAFGFQAHVHFSLIMIAGLMSYFPDISLIYLIENSQILVIYLIIGALIGYILGDHGVYKWSYLSRINHILFATISIFLMSHLIQANALAVNLKIAAFDLNSITFVSIVVAFILNGLAPYIGYKFDFSLAMFSNLRPDRWNHYIIPRPLIQFKIRYLQICNITFYSTKEKEKERILLKLSEMFPNTTTESYMIGYVSDVLCNVKKIINNGKISLTTMEISSGRKIEISTSNPKIDLHLLEQFSVYPLLFRFPMTILCVIELLAIPILIFIIKHVIRGIF